MPKHSMAEHSLALYTLCLYFLGVLAVMIAFGMFIEWREKKRLEQAYDQSVANRARLQAQLDETEAAVIAHQRDHMLNDYTERHA